MREGEEELCKESEEEEEVKNEKIMEYNVQIKMQVIF